MAQGTLALALFLDGLLAGLWCGAAAGALAADQRHALVISDGP